MLSRRFLSIVGAKKRKAAVPTTRHTSPGPTANETNPSPKPISPALPPAEELTKSLSDDVPVEFANDQTTCRIVDDLDDDDIMPVVASVEEEQPIEELIPSETGRIVLIVESNDCNGERIQAEEIAAACSPAYEPSAVTNPSHEDGSDETEPTVRSREPSPSCSTVVPPQSPQLNQKRAIRKRQRNGYVKPRSRGRSSSARAPKRLRPLDDNPEENTSLITIITSEKIEQHLRTLFMAVNDTKRTRTRPVKTPTRLVEEINGTIITKPTESDTNVFDILSSSTMTMTADPNEQHELTENSQHPCKYNVVASIKPNKLGLTIKKVAPP